MRTVLKLLLALAVVVALASPLNASEADEWGQYQKDKSNSGFFEVAVPDNGKVSGKTSAVKARDGSQPVVAGNLAYIYTGINDTSGSIVCLDMLTGEKAWETPVDPPSSNGSWSSPAVSGGLVYIGSGSKVFALDALTGRKVWAKSLGPDADIVNSSPTVDGDRLFIGDWNSANNGRYLCLDALTGDIIWQFKLDTSCHAQSTPAVDGERVYVGQFGATFGVPDGKVWCLNRSDGKPVASWGTGGFFRTKGKLDVTGSVAVSGDFIYFTDFTFGVAAEPNSHLYCLDKETGSQQWVADVFPSSGTPAVGEGLVVTAGNQWASWPEPSTNWTFAFNAEPASGGSAEMRWKVKGAGGWTASPAIADGRVLVGIFDSTTFQNKGLCCLEAENGKTKWISNEGGSSPVPTRYGVLSIGEGKVVVFGGKVQTRSEYYFAEGTTREGYQEWICLENATDSVVNTNIRYLLSDGSTKDQEVALPANSRTTVDVNLFLGPGCDAAAHVTGDGPFVAERAMYVNSGGISGGEQVAGKPRAGKTFLFAEGTTREGYQTWLTLCNPQDTEANVIITYMYQGKDPGALNVTLPPHSRETVDVNLSAGAEEDVSIAVTSDSDIAAERVMYFQGVEPLMGASPNGVHNYTGAEEASTSWYFAEGTTRANFREWLCLMNPGGEPATATVRYLTSDRGVVAETKVLPPVSRTTVDVGADIGAETDISMYITSDRPVVAERPVYFQYIPAGLPNQTWGGGHDSTGAIYAAYRWDFAEGTTRPGFQTYLCIGNPSNLTVEVTVDYILNAGGRRNAASEKVKIAANSRFTIDVNSAIGEGADVSMSVTSAVPVVVERPMYFNNQGYVGGGVSLGAADTL